MKANLILKHPTLNRARNAPTRRPRDRRQAIQLACIEALEERRMLSFSPVSIYSVGSPPKAVVSADFNGDDHLDLVTAGNSPTISILLGNANGTFQPAQSVNASVSPWNLAVGDFNNDGKPDLVTTSFGDVFGGGGSAGVLLGNGNGTFQPAQSIILPGQFPPGYTGVTARPQAPTSVAVGDINADGKLDLAITAQTGFSVLTYVGYYGNYYENHYGSYVNVLLGNGNGTFGTASASVTLTENSTFQAVGLEDLNGDHKLDLLLTNFNVDARLGNGNGTFQAPATSNFNVFPSMRGDFDNDGRLDLIGIDPPGGVGAVVLKGQGDGTFQKSSDLNLFPIGSTVVGDVNADGKLDLVGMNSQVGSSGYDYYGNPIDPFTSTSAKVLLGYGDRSFTLGTSTSVGSHPGYSYFNSVVLGDFNGDGRLDLAATDSGFSTVSVALNASDWGTLPPAVRVSDATVIEGDAGTINAVFTVTVEHPGSQSLTVNYSTADKRATLAGGDYQAASGSLTFTPGQTSKTITVKVNGDRIGEFNETFSVNLTAAANIDIVRGVGLGTILDNEPRVSISNATLAEPDSGTVLISFIVTLSDPYDQPVTVHYSTADNVAVAGKDFNALIGTLTFAPGETSKTIAVAIKGDLIDEFDETFLVNLSGANNALIVNAQGVGTIVDNDATPSVVVNDVTRKEGNSGRIAFTFTISLSQLTEKAPRVVFSITDGTAMASDQDYDAWYNNPFSLYFYDATKLSQTLTVYVLGDRKKEPSEMFFVNLAYPVDVTIADAQGAGIILDDDGPVKTWAGPTTGGNWSIAANWSPSGVPGSNDDVQISGGSSVSLATSSCVRGLSLSGGASLTVATGGTRVFRTTGLAIDGKSRLDLTNNDLIQQSTVAERTADLATVRDLIKSGNNLGLWNGAGITSSAAESNKLKGFGFALNDKGGGILLDTSFDGISVDANSILVKYTYNADADLDGNVGFADLTKLAQNYGTTGRMFSDGDFNHDGNVDFADMVVIAQSYGMTTSSAIAATPATMARQSEILSDLRRSEDRVFKHAVRIRKPVVIMKPACVARH